MKLLGACLLGLLLAVALAAAVAVAYWLATDRDDGDE